MRALIAGAFILISFAFLPLHGPSIALADGAYRCKGGPGWRGPDGFCVSQSKLATVCGSPPGTPCKQEGAARVCFGKQATPSDVGPHATP